MIQGKITQYTSQLRMPIGGGRVVLTLAGKLSRVGVRVSLQEKATCCR